MAGDFTVNGVPADSASQSPDGATITYTYDTSPVVNQGVQTMTLPADTVIGANDGLPNVGAFTTSFFYVQTQLEVSATSPAVGSVFTFSSSPGTQDLVVQFNKAIDPYSISTSNFQVSQGTITKAVPLIPNAVDLTISGITQNGYLTLTLAAGTLKDSFGVPNLPFSGTYGVDIATQGYPVPLAQAAPKGSLIYDPSVSGALVYPGETNTYTLNISAGQSLSQVLTVDSGLIGTITLKGPGGNTIASATGSGPGATVVLESSPIATSGTYSLIVGSSGGTIGSYTLQAILNALYDSSTSTNNSIATATDLSNSFTSLGTTPFADRAGVVGQLQEVTGGLNNYGYSAASVSPTFIDITGTGTPTLQGVDDGYYNIGSSALGGFSFKFYGQSYNSLYFSSNGLITFKQGDSEYFNQDLSSDPSTPTISPLWDDQIIFNPNISPSAVYYQVEGSQLIIEWSNVTFYDNPSGAPVTYEAVLDSSDNSIQFNYANLYAGSPPHDNGGSATVGIKDDNSAAGGADPIVLDYNSGPNTYVNSYVSTRITAPATPPDYYAVSLAAGRSSTIAVKGAGSNAEVALYDASGNLLALGDPSGNGVDSVISNFVAQSSGTYYVAVTGLPGLQYDLVVTRGSDFGLHGSSFDKAQPLNGAGVVLGAVVAGGGSLYTLDDQLYSAFNPIYPTDPATGAFTGASIPQPGSPQNNPFGLNLAYDGTSLYFNDGPLFGNNDVYVMDPSTGTVLSSFLPQEPYYLFDIAWLNGHLWGTDSANIYEFDSSGAVLQQFNNVVSNATGLTGDADNGMLYAVSQFNTIYEIDPDTGTVVASAPDNAQGAYEQDLAYAGGLLIVSDTYSNSLGSNYLDEYDPNTLAFVARVPVATQGFVSGLGGDGLGGVSSDWYQFNVNAGDNLVITTTTPGGPSASGLQFANDLDPDDQPLRRQRQPGRHRDRQRRRRPQRRHRLDGSDVGQLPGADPRRRPRTTWASTRSASRAPPAAPTPSPLPRPTRRPDRTSATRSRRMTSTFSSSVLLSSVSTSDFTIDGNNATGVTVVNSTTLELQLPHDRPTACTTSRSAASKTSRASSLTPDNFSFKTDDVPPDVVSSSIADGAVLLAGDDHRGRHVQQADSAGARSTTPTSSLYGEVRGKSYTPSSISFDPTDTILTITYTSLPTDAYQFTLEAGPSNFLSNAGVPLQNSFVINFTVPVRHEPDHRPPAGLAARQPGLRYHDRRRAAVVGRCRDLRPDDRSPPDVWR